MDFIEMKNYEDCVQLNCGQNRVSNQLKPCKTAHRNEVLQWILDQNSETKIYTHLDQFHSNEISIRI